MKRTKVVYILSEINKSLAFEWISERLDRNKFELSFFLIGNKNTALSIALKEKGIPLTEYLFQSKRDLLLIFIQIFFRLMWMRPRVIHTHLFYANLIGLTAAWILRIPKRIFTRHHAMVHYHEFLIGRKWDRWCNKTATHIIAISENVKYILITYDRCMPEKIRLIHHGFDLPYFAEVGQKRISQLEKQYPSTNTFPVVGVIARFIKWKGIQYIIPAFLKLRNSFPQAHLVLANAIGNYETEIGEQLSALPQDSYTTIRFEDDLAALYHVFDVYVHTPIDKESEASGQTYVEALAAGIPSVFTLSGVAPEFIEHQRNALVVPYKNPEAIENAMKQILSDSKLADRLIEQGRKSVETFSIERMITNLTALYE